MVSIKQLALLALATGLAAVDAQTVGKTTRYWDCCKPSCAWPDKALVFNPVKTCSNDDKAISDHNAINGCGGGPAFMCTNQSPWIVSPTLSYGFAAVHIAGGSENTWCCACYELTFTDGTVKGKKMIVQATNTGPDLGENHFDLAIPGGGFGINDGCTKQFPTTPPAKWAERYGGVNYASACNGLPKKLQGGCNWRFNWFRNANNPPVTFKEVACPAAITSRSGCARK